MLEWYSHLSIIQAALLIIAVVLWIVVGAVGGMFWGALTWNGRQGVSTTWALLMGWFWPILWPATTAYYAIDKWWFNTKQTAKKKMEEKAAEVKQKQITPAIPRSQVEEIFKFVVFNEATADYNTSPYNYRKANNKYQEFEQIDLKQEYISAEFDSILELTNYARKSCSYGKLGIQHLNRATGYWADPEPVTPDDEPNNWHIVTVDISHNAEIYSWIENNVTDEFIKLDSTRTTVGSDAWSFRSEQDAVLFTLKWK